jgi:hypothetical protein
MADPLKPLDLPRTPDSKGWAGEPDLAAVYALAACLAVGAMIFLFSAVARL